MKSHQGSMGIYKSGKTNNTIKKGENYETILQLLPLFLSIGGLLFAIEVQNALDLTPVWCYREQ